MIPGNDSFFYFAEIFLFIKVGELYILLVKKS